MRDVICNCGNKADLIRFNTFEYYYCQECKKEVDDILMVNNQTNFEWEGGNSYPIDRFYRYNCYSCGASYGSNKSESYCQFCLSATLTKRLVK